VIVTDRVFVKPMSLEEAILQMELNRKAQFLVFTNASSEQINVIYRRKDGAFGLIETQTE